VSDALRRLVDPEQIANFLVGVVADRKAPLRDRMRAAEMITDRLDGRPVSFGVHANVTAPGALPADWASRSLDQRREFLDAIEASAVEVRK